MLVIMMEYEKKDEKTPLVPQINEDSKKQDIIRNIFKELKTLEPDDVIRRGELLDNEVLAPLNWKGKRLQELTIKMLEQVYKDSVKYVSEHQVDVRKPENEAQAGNDDTQKDEKEEKQELILNIHKVLSSIYPDGLKRAELLEEKILAPLNWKGKELDDLTITKLEQVYKDSVKYVSEHSVDVRKPEDEMTVTKETGVTIQEEEFLSPEDIEEERDDKPLNLTGQPLVRIKKEIEIQLSRHYPTLESQKKYINDWTFGIGLDGMSEENAIRVYKGIFADMKQLNKKKAKEVEVK